MDKSPDAFRTISEVADWLGTPTHVLRFWESRFTQIKPVKRAGGRRYYRPGDMALLGGIKKLLHDDGLTIRGVQKILREQGVKYVSSLSQSVDGDADEAAVALDVPTQPPVGEVVQMRPEPAAPAPESVNPFAAAPDSDVPETARTQADGGLGADLNDDSADESTEAAENVFRNGDPGDLPAGSDLAGDDTGAPPADPVPVATDANVDQPVRTAPADPEAEPHPDQDGKPEEAAEFASFGRDSADVTDSPPPSDDMAEPAANDAPAFFRPRATAPAPEPSPEPAHTAEPAALPETPSAPDAPAATARPLDLPEPPPLAEGPSLSEQVLARLRKGTRPAPDAVRPVYERLSALHARMTSGPHG